MITGKRIPPEHFIQHSNMIMNKDNIKFHYLDFSNFISINTFSSRKDINQQKRVEKYVQHVCANEMDGKHQGGVSSFSTNLINTRLLESSFL